MWRDSFGKQKAGVAKVSEGRPQRLLPTILTTYGKGPTYPDLRVGLRLTLTLTLRSRFVLSFRIKSALFLISTVKFKFIILLLYFILLWSFSSRTLS